MKVLKIIFSILILPLVLSLVFAFLIGIFYGVGSLVIHFNIDVLSFLYRASSFSDYVMGGMLYLLITLVATFIILIFILFAVEIYEVIK